MEFDLLKEPFIPIQDKAGIVGHYSITEALQSAHNFVRVVHDKPLVIASVQRLLLAILYRSLGYLKKSQWRELYEKEAFDQAVFDYLASDKCVGRFDLFSKEHPFFQTARFTKDKGVTTSVKKLSPEYATGNNKTLFSHMLDHQSFSLTPADAALHLLVCQYFSLGGGISGSSNLFGKHPNFTNAPLIGGAVAWVEEESLFQSLLLNLEMPKDKAQLDPEIDKPVWEQDEPEAPAERAVRGLSDYLTWRSRHILLLPEEDGSVARMYFSQGLPNPTEWKEPYFAYRKSAEGKLLPIRFNFERSFWRDSVSLLHLTEVENGEVQPEDRRSAGIRNIAKFSDDLEGSRFTCQLIGLDNNKANPLNWYQQTMPVDVAYLLADPEDENKISVGKHLKQAIQLAERINYALSDAIKSFAKAMLPEGSQQKEINARTSAINAERYYWPKLDSEFEQLLYALLIDTDEATSIWRSHCRKVAKDAYTQATKAWLTGGGRALKAHADGLSVLQQKLDGRRYIPEPNIQATTHELVSTLERWANPHAPNRQVLASLRNGLDFQASSQLKAMPYIGSFLTGSSWHNEVYSLVAALFSFHPMSASKSMTLGASLKQLEKHDNPGIKFRVTSLLESDRSKLKTELRQLFAILKSEDIAVNYRLLAEDLIKWEDAYKTIQIKWAQDFWPAPQSEK